MATKQKDIQQGEYTSRCLEEGDAPQRLQDQWMAIMKLAAVDTQKDFETLQAAVQEIDTQLIKYSLTSLRSNLQRVARGDCAQLIADSVLDTSVKESSIKRWEDWLTAAPCWPTLAKTYWYEATHAAAELVVEALTAAGVTFDTDTRSALEKEIYALKLADLLPEALMNEIFPSETAVEETF